MKVGDLVRDGCNRQRVSFRRFQREQEDLGVVIGSEGELWVVVYWNDKYPAEVEDKDCLEILNETR